VKLDGEDVATVPSVCPSRFWLGSTLRPVARFQNGEDERRRGHEGPLSM
jgi:hypothetical protein